MSNQQSEQQPTETSMILTPRQQHLQRVRDEMAPGERPAAIVPHTFAEVVTMCEALARADIAPKALRGKVMDMALVIMTGAEVGLPPMASLRLYTTWDGVPRLMAEGVRAIILQSSAIEYFEMATCDDNHATWIGKRRGRPEKSVTWTLERAKKAGLLTKENWIKYSQDMLNARASMQLGRIIAPDVVAGMVALEEAKDGDFIDAQSVEAKPAFVAPPAPSGLSRPETGHTIVTPQVAVVRDTPQGPQAVTVTDTGTKPSEPPKRGPGRPPKAQPSQTPGTDPFRAAREAVDQRAAEQGKANLATEIKKVEDMQDAAIQAAMVERDKWGQPVADPTSGGGSPSSSTTSTSAGSETPSTASTESAPADDFGGSEDPQDSQPEPLTDPGLALLDELRTFLAGCKSQTEMQNGRPPFAQRSQELFKNGDRRFESASNGKPAGELASQLGALWADRKRQLPV